MLDLKLPYTHHLLSYRRRATRPVMVGNVGIGGDNPIRIQSMTTTLTKDIEATVAQTQRLVQVGCEIVRITTPTPNDARCLGPIKEELERKGIDVPLVADIHFSPAAALVAADFADKVRVNPGNYSDSRKFAVREYSDDEYFGELERVEERFTPLVLKCKDRGISMRIGTNHGSLSDRVMNRFGDSPEGMVESALEFVRICGKHDYHDVILSMKASNPKVMIAAYRLLSARMAEEGMDYPFHLGVTEAGNDEDGRIKSAIGIGSLLEDGIGDTIRVSLTEEPEAEIPVAFAIANRYTPRSGEGSAPSSAALPPGSAADSNTPWDFYHFERRRSGEVGLGPLKLGGSNTVAVIAPIEGPLSQQDKAMAHVLRWASPSGKRQPKPDAALLHIESPDDLVTLKSISEWLSKWPQAQLSLIAKSEDAPLLMDALPYVQSVMQTVVADDDVTVLACALVDTDKTLILDVEIDDPDKTDAAIDELVRVVTDVSRQGVRVIPSVRTAHESIYANRKLAMRMADQSIAAPILLQFDIRSDPLLSPSIALGSLLCDGIGDAVMLTCRSLPDLDDTTELTFNILQAAGTRISKTDYVACPSCGRTLFDLQETTDRIKRRTSHLVGVRLAIMGCIVNGPGEMADADFGYVGGAPGQVNLYVGKECVEKGVPAEIADDRLIELIKAHGKWEESDEESSPIV